MKTTGTTKNIDFYLSLPYTVILKRDDEGDFVARIEELDGCMSHGANEAEALEHLKEMQALWLQDCIESGDAIPEPTSAEDPLPSGKWVQRVPRSLHYNLTKLAKKEDVSLNQLVTSILSGAVAAKHTRQEPPVPDVWEQVADSFFHIAGGWTSHPLYVATDVGMRSVESGQHLLHSLDNARRLALPQFLSGGLTTYEKENEDAGYCCVPARGTKR